jgi:hypothetical protein
VPIWAIHGSVQYSTKLDDRRRPPGQNGLVASEQGFIEPEPVLREAWDKELALLEAAYAGRRSIRDRLRFWRAKRRLTSACSRGRWLAKW